MGFNFDQSKRGQYRKKKTVGPYQQGAPNPPAPSTMHYAPKAPAPPAPSTMHNAPASTADAGEERMGPYTQGVSTATGGTALAVDAAADAAAIAAAAEDERKRKESQKKQEEAAAAAAAAAAEDARRQQEAANLSEVMEAIRTGKFIYDVSGSAR